MHFLRTTFLFALLVAPALDAQATFYGYRDVGIANVTNSGTKSLAARVYYPSTKNGANTPLKSKTGGYPVVVHLHGLGGRGRNYALLGENLARNGFVAVLQDTARFNADQQVLDGIALFKSLEAENKRTNSPFKSALDMTRAGVCGHSMGGGSTVRTLAANPGYRAGFGFAPWDGTINGQGNSWTRFSSSVKVPLTIFHGEGDTVVNWKTSGLDFHNKATNITGHKVFVLFNKSATHSNIINLPFFPTAADRAIQARGMAMVTGWFDRHLRGGVQGLEQVAGNTVRKDRYFTSLTHEYRVPELWSQGTAKIGSTGSLNLGGEPGNGAVWFSIGTKTTKLPFGTLKLDPAFLLPAYTGKLGAGRLLFQTAKIPSDASLAGTRLWFQGITDGGKPGLQLTDVVPVVITK